MAEPKQRFIVHSDAVAPLLDIYLGWCRKHRAPHIHEWYRYCLGRFVQTYPHMRVQELRPYHVQEWLDEMDLSSGSKRHYCRSIERAMSWARRQGYLDLNPIADMEEPHCGKKDLVVSAAEFERILELSPDECFRDLLRTTWETGCRVIEQSEGARSPYGIILFGHGDDGCTVPNMAPHRETLRAELDKAAQLIKAMQTGHQHVDPPQSLSICKGCQHGRPREYLRGQSETTLHGQQLTPFTTKGDDRKHYHSPCGDRFGWIPPHELAGVKGLR